MALQVGWITIDTPEPAKLAAFWEQLLGWRRGEDFHQGLELVAPEGGQRLLLWRAPDAKVVKNRMHLDLVPDDQEAEVARAIALGARRVDIGQGDEAEHVVLADPEGN